MGGFFGKQFADNLHLNELTYILVYENILIYLIAQIVNLIAPWKLNE